MANLLKRIFDRTLKLAGTLHTTANPTLADGDAWPLRSDVAGNLLVAGGSGGSPIPIIPGQEVSLGQFTFTVDDVTAKNFANNGAIPAGATIVFVQITTGAPNKFCRWRDTGLAPTAVSGVPLLPGQPLVLTTNPLSSAKIIGSDPGPTEVNATFYKSA